jgi:hypothetical protein
MTEGYKRMTTALSDDGPGKPVLSDTTADEVLFSIQFGMTYSAGKNHSRPAHEAAIKLLAQMIYATSPSRAL